LLRANQASGNDADHRLVSNSGDSNIRTGVPQLPLRVFHVAIWTEGRRFDHSRLWKKTVGKRRRRLARRVVVARKDDVERHAHAHEPPSLPPDTRDSLLGQSRRAWKPGFDAVSEDVNFGWHKVLIVTWPGTFRGTLHKLYKDDSGLRAGNRER